jgi:acetyl-CoA C-acetyltransferase
VTDERLPVLVGVAQWIQRDAPPLEAPDPLAALEAVARAAAADARAGARLLAAADTVGVVQVAGWAPANAPRLLAERVGARPACELATGAGGEVPLRLVNAAAERIAAGRSRVALLAGAHPMRTLRRAQAEGVALRWPGGGAGAPERIGDERTGHDACEARHGLDAPIRVYPLIESALRARRGLGLGAHRARLGRLFAPFTRVAKRNPYAWFPVERSAEELVRAGPANRMVAYPYTKYLNAVLDTDQAAALLLCSAAAARAFGIPEQRWVHWWGGAHTEERAWHVSRRPEIGASPALRECAARALAAAGVDAEELAAIDFYSCFPVAVELACEAYGVPEDDVRGLTVTGGLPYAGGPGSSYALHAVAAMAERLRAWPGARGLTTGNGWYLSKHAASVWASAPPRGAVGAPLEAPVVVGPAPLPLREDARGAATLDAWTVSHARDGAPERGIVVGRLASGERFVANTPGERGFLEAFEAAEQVGRAGSVRPAGEPGGHLFFEPGGRLSEPGGRLLFEPG